MEMDKYSSLFESEAKEILQSFEEGIIALEKEPKSGEIVDELFRLAHTLKGVAGMMGFRKISAVAHAAENILDSLREGEIDASSITDLLLEIRDSVSKMVESAVAGEDSEVNPEELIAKTEAAVKRAKTKEKRKIKKPARREGKIEAIEKRGEEIERIESVKISSERLDRWTNLLGELLILKTRFQEIAKAYRVKELDEAVSDLVKNLTEIRDDLLAARLVPAGVIFNRFPRMVRDMAKVEGKEVNFTIGGGDIELDRLILDRLSEPLVHLIKNAVVHGIERLEERTKIGKKRIGKVNLSAERSENRIIIRVEDDGRGVDPSEIRKIAVERGLLKGEETISDEMAVELLFAPGFTTVSEPTESSGRGVGLEAVRQLARSMSGSCELATKKGGGTIVTLSLPLTTAIIQALIVKVADRFFALPLDDVLENLQVNSSDVKLAGGKETILLRDQIVPLFRLATIFDVSYTDKDPFFVVVVKRGSDLYGLIVDSLFTKQEIQVKPLDPLLRDLRWISGSTILGDGSVSLILDINALPIGA